MDRTTSETADSDMLGSEALSEPLDANRGQHVSLMQLYVARGVDHTKRRRMSSKEEMLSQWYCLAADMTAGRFLRQYSDQLLQGMPGWAGVTCRATPDLSTD